MMRESGDRPTAHNQSIDFEGKVDGDAFEPTAIAVGIRTVAVFFPPEREWSCFPMMETRKKCVTLVLGGARSGKSRYAQQIASRCQRVTFIATARPSDSEMRRKISQHRQERPAGWKTVEAPVYLGTAIDLESQRADMLLVDCLTVFVGNFVGAKKGARESFRKNIEQVCSAIRSSKASIVVVSNEVGSGVVPAFRSGRIYRDLLGQMNQQVAEIADRVILMVAGVAVTVKDSAAS